MATSDVKQRSVLLGVFQDSAAMDDRREAFEGELRSILDELKVSNVTWHINQFPIQVKQDDGRNAIAFRLYAKVSWPAEIRSVGRVAVMEMHDLLDKYNAEEQRLPPI